MSCRSSTHSILGRGTLPPNYYLTAALAGSYGLQALAFLIPGLRNLLGLTSLDATDAMMVMAGAVAPFLVNETTKLLTFDGADDNTRRSKAEARPYAGAAAIEPASGLRKAEH